MVLKGSIQAASITLLQLRRLLKFNYIQPSSPWTLSVKAFGSEGWIIFVNTLEALLGGAPYDTFNLTEYTSLNSNLVVKKLS